MPESEPEGGSVPLLDLNTAAKATLERFISPDMLDDVLSKRPFIDWEDAKRKGVSSSIIHALSAAGVTIGN